MCLQPEGIEHRTRRVKRPQSNGFVQRLYRTLLEDCFRVMGRKKVCEAVGEMQSGPEDYLKAYNCGSLRQIAA